MCESVHAYASVSFAVNEGSKMVDTRTVWAEDQSLAALNVSVVVDFSTVQNSDGEATTLTVTASLMLLGAAPALSFGERNWKFSDPE